MKYRDLGEKEKVEKGDEVQLGNGKWRGSNNWEEGRQGGGLKNKIDFFSQFHIFGLKRMIVCLCRIVTNQPGISRIR